MTPRTPLDAWVTAKIGAPGLNLLRSDLEAYQLEHLNAALELAAKKSPFYRRHLAHSPQRLGSLEEITVLPFTTAGHLRQCGTEMVCVSQSEIERIVTLDTSGTTGDPKRLYFTRADQELTIDFFQHGMSTFTRPGDNVMILLPYERPGSVGDLLAIGLRRLGANPVNYGPVRDPQHALRIMQAMNIDGLVGAPTHLLALAWFFALSGLQPSCAPCHVLLSTDYVPNAITAALQTIWGCTTYNHYGMTEMGLGGGVDCLATAGYHLREADLYFEIIDPHTGWPVPPGRSGEVVFTTLTRRGMPLVRYRTGDLARWIPEPCGCGTALKTMDHVRGRYAGLAQLVEDSPEWLAMADLDEALFAIPSVLNFTVALSGDLCHACLALDLTLLPPAKNDWRTQAGAALDNIPAVRRARQAGRLDVHLSARLYDPAQAGSLAKRRIIDLRSGVIPPT